MERIILHSDMNCFYASVEALYHPEYDGLPLAVGGKAENRHGIILAKNQLAKEAGVKTGEALWEARLKSPKLIIIEPNYSRYLKFSKMARQIYNRYSNLVESFGLDEAWIDVTGNKDLSGLACAKKISRDIKEELGLTVSIGVSWNKIFAKFGSDYKNPDAITVIDHHNYKKIVWESDVGELLYVGPKTKKKLKKYGIDTIGELALGSPDFLNQQFGKMGTVIWRFANGLDQSLVKEFDEKENNNHRDLKSIGNSITTLRDIKTLDEAKGILYMLSESVGMRLRESESLCETVGIQVRTSGLNSFTRQIKLKKPSNLTQEIAEASFALFKQNLEFPLLIRSLGVHVSALVEDTDTVQLDLFGCEENRIRLGQLDTTLDGLRQRFGNQTVKRGIMMGDLFTEMDPKKKHIIHPLGYF